MRVFRLGRLLHISLEPREWWCWISILPVKNTPWSSRNVPRGRWAWEIFPWGGKTVFLRHHGTNAAD